MYCVKSLYTISTSNEVSLNCTCIPSSLHDFFSCSVFAGLCHAPGIFNRTLTLVPNAALIFPENTSQQKIWNGKVIVIYLKLRDFNTVRVMVNMVLCLWYCLILLVTILSIWTTSLLYTNFAVRDIWKVKLK